MVEVPTPKFTLKQKVRVKGSSTDYQIIAVHITQETIDTWVVSYSIRRSDESSRFASTARENSLEPAPKYLEWFIGQVYRYVPAEDIERLPAGAVILVGGSDLYFVTMHNSVEWLVHTSGDLCSPDYISRASLSQTIEVVSLP